jgi:CDP-glucose 4,6-dehydratase
MQSPSPSFWRGKRVFLTGHTGFKGGWAALWLSQLGAEVHGYSLPAPTEPNLFKLAYVEDCLASHELGDIRDLPKLQAVMKAAKPDIVMHFAAQPLLRLSYDEPVETYAVNAMGTVHVLEAARQVGSRINIMVTTDKCYENREQDDAYVETDPMGGFDPYSSSKGCAELITSAYGRSYFSKGTACAASVRAGNVIGGGDWAKDRLMTDIIAALSNKKRPVLRNPSAIRPWQHVMEPVSGYMMAAEYLWNTMPRAPEAWNFGPDADSDVQVGTVAKTVCDLWGSGIEPEFTPDPRQLHEAKLLKLDSTKAKTELNWAPRLSLREALSLTVEWFKAHQTGANMRAVTEQQIKHYTSKQVQTAPVLKEKIA